MSDVYSGSRDASAFARLHDPANPLLLPNAWDAASARIFEAAGFPAIATTSAGVAFALGAADGEAVDLDELVAATARIVRTVRVPVSADFEAGFAREPDAVVANVARIAGTGVAGINLEDWDPHANQAFALDLAAARVAAVKARFGDRLFVNARTDLYLQEAGDPAARLDATVARLRAFVAAGADGVFVPGVDDEPTLAALAAATAKPLNALAGPASPPLARMRELGVARVSVGVAPMRRILGELRAVASELHDDGTYGFMRDPRNVTFGEVNALFATRV